ncbi:MAG: cytochrome c oxidase accessory protein CcoG [Saprospiraceae bacterium]|nr:cytochrome c oxidase accessory protein CcoG [Saprospiraceae bacterium]
MDSNIDQQQQEEQFRDKIATVDKKGKRIWIFPKKPSGKYYNYRTYLSWFYVVILFALPFIKVNGEPFVLMDVVNRNFILFGMHFGPQDFYLFAIGMLILLVFIILFTVVFGRIFCGWVCPQTIFMEMIFRKIEYAIEGDYKAQMKLDNAPWDGSKITKRVLKHAIFFGIAVLIANIFLAYIIGIDEVFKIIREPISAHFTGFLIMVLRSFVFYIVFSSLREQVCTTICPYGRLQGVMLDNKSLVVAYDFVRGEPRGKIKKTKVVPLPILSEAQVAEEKSLNLAANGDCIDCKLCVHVCPTGIDIRNGTQLECVNCTACMDACDEVMEKINRPKGLVRIDSLEGITEGKHKIFNTRVKAYSIVLLVLLVIEGALFTMRSDIQGLMLRTPGMTYQTMEGGYVSNLYNYQLINKTGHEYDVTLKLMDVEGEITLVGSPDLHLSKNSQIKGSAFVKIHSDKLHSRKNKLTVGVYSGDQLISKIKTSFFSPPK